MSRSRGSGLSTCSGRDIEGVTTQLEGLATENLVATRISAGNARPLDHFGPMNADTPRNNGPMNADTLRNNGPPMNADKPGNNGPMNADKPGNKGPMSGKWGVVTSCRGSRRLWRSFS
jgi:hypothetical protein